MHNMGDSHGQTSLFRQVEDWLRSLGLICYAQSFYDNGYENLEICMQITEEDLKVIGITNVKDKNDILAGCCRLKQKAVYFELEAEHEEPQAVVFRKFDPFLLKTRVKAEIEKDNVQLTVPPYFYPDGSLGSLESLAEQLSYKLETFKEDVLSALDQLRRKQLPAGLYNDVNEMMEMQRDQEQKKRVNPAVIAPPKPKRTVREEPKDYLNVETPFKRTSSLSVHDRRITKSTTNLADMDLDQKPLITASKKDKKSKQLSKSQSTREKSKNLLGLSVRKKSTSSEKKGQKSRDSFVAKDLTFDQQQLIDLMTKVKHGEMSEESALAQATRNYRQSIYGDTTHSKGIEKHQLTKKEKKKLEKEEKKRKKIERGKSTGHSLFYTSDRPDSNADSRHLHDIEDSQFDEIVSLGHSSGSDISRESPDLRSFVERIIPRTNNGHAGFLADGSPSSSTGNLNIDRGTPERRSTGSSSVKSLSKPANNPPPVPLNRSHESGGHHSTESESQGSPAGKRSLKPTLSAPSPSRTAIGQRRFSPAHSDQNEALSDKGQVFSKQKPSSCNSMPRGASDESMFQVKSLPFGSKDLQAIKEKSNEMKSRSMHPNKSSTDNTNNEKSKALVPRLDSSSAPSKNPPKPPTRSVASNDVISGPTESPEMRTDQGRAEAEQGKKLPVPLPRRTNVPSTAESEGRDSMATNEQRPVIPPRKRRSVSLDPASEKTSNVAVPVAEKKADSIPGASKPSTKPKPVLPLRQVREIKEPDKQTTSAPSHSRTEESKPHFQAHQTQAKTGGDHAVVDSQPMAIRLRTLEDLIQRKLEREDVDISEWPYTDQEGGWGVPFPLVARYSTELEKPLEPVIRSMDKVRCERLQQSGREAKQAVLVEVLQSSDLDPIKSSVSAWLISVGLPMFIRDFKECGVSCLEGLHDLAREDVLGMGLYDGRHVDELLRRLRGDM